MFHGDFRLFVGLGNPGSKYRETRHNIGFMALEKLAANQSAKFNSKQKLHGQIAEVIINQKPLKLLLPDTFMNDSGRSIRAVLDWFDIDISQLLVIVDDMDLPMGKLRLRKQGSDGGHNGLRSTINHLGTQNFCRLRIGIGPPTNRNADRKSQTISHVLGRFTKDESSQLEQVLEEVLLGLELIQTKGLQIAANRINAYQPQECP